MILADDDLLDLVLHPLERTGGFGRRSGRRVVIGGEVAQNWQILRNGSTTIGLFQGMFPQNLLTFNPGWSSKAEPLPEFTDVREIQRQLEEHGLELQSRADDSTTGPASLTLIDPDGNSILIDQHV